MELARKISISGLVKPSTLKRIKERVFLGRIYGYARACVTMPTQYGDSSKLKGEFIQVKGESKVLSSILLLPVNETNQIRDLIMSSGQGVKFGFDVYAVPSNLTPAGFSWLLVSLMDMELSPSLLDFANGFPEMEKQQDTK
jgi:hypothetical protein